VTRAAVLPPALSKEIRAVFPLWAASVAALAAAALVWQGGRLVNLGLFAYVSGSLAIGAQSVGHEYAYRTLPMLLSQPADRRRLYLTKCVVSAVMLLLFAALAWTMAADTWQREPDRVPTLILPVLCGLFLAPLLTMICRSTLAGMILTGSLLGLTWIVALAIAWFGFQIAPETAEKAVFDRWLPVAMVLCPLAGLLGWRRFTRLEATEAASPGLPLPRWVTSGPGARRHAPWQALAVKEIHLQQPAFVVVGLYIVSWALIVLAQRYIPSWSTLPLEAVMLLYCMGLTILIGALASAEERQHGTLDSQLLQPAPAWHQWMVKVGVAYALALLFGVGLPVLLSGLTPLEGSRALRIPGHFTELIVLLTAGSLYLSSLSGSGVRAMVLSLPIGIAVAVFIQMVSRALGISASSMDPAAVVSAAARTCALTLVPLLLWFGFLNHTSSERTGRQLALQVGSIALLITIVLVLVAGVR
jgi:hypothetical protein